MFFFVRNKETVPPRRVCLCPHFYLLPTTVSTVLFYNSIFSLPSPLPRLPRQFICARVSFCQGPYGNFGKVDDFKVIGAKMETKGKREYRREKNK